MREPARSSKALLIQRMAESWSPKARNRLHVQLATNLGGILACRNTPNGTDGADHKLRKMAEAGNQGIRHSQAQILILRAFVEGLKRQHREGADPRHLGRRRLGPVRVAQDQEHHEQGKDENQRGSHPTGEPWVVGSGWR
jgi:hypothetical protein